MSEKVEIRTELLMAGVETLNRQLSDIRDGMLQVDKSTDEVKSGWGEWIQVAHGAMGVLGTNLTDIVGKVRDFGAELIGAGHAAESGDVALATMISTTQNIPFDEAMGKAEQFGDRLDEMALKVGISDEAVGDAFQHMVELGGASEKALAHSAERLEDIAQISSKLGKNAAGLSDEYSFMAEGVLKTKGQLFQLLQTTGIFGTDTKKAAAAWAQLTEEKRIELLDYGLGKIGGEVAKMPTFFGDASDALGSMVRLAKQDVGQPIVESITPAIQDLANEIMEMRPDLSEFGHLFADEVGGGVREGGRLLKEGLHWLRDHKAEIAEDLKKAGQAVRDAFEFVLAHKNEIALAFGAKAAMPVLKPVAGAVAGVAQAGYGGAGGGVMGLAGGGVAGAAASLGALTAAVIALGLAADQAAKLATELADAEDTRYGGMKRLADLADAGDVENVRNTAQTMMQLDEAAGRMNPKLKAFYESTIRTAERQEQWGKDQEDALKKQIAMGARGAADAEAMGGVRGGEAQAQVQTFAQNQVAILVNAYNQAMSQGNREMATLAATTIASGNMVSKAFLDTNQKLVGGFGDMAELLMSAGDQFAGFASQLKGKSATPPAPKILMPGAKITVNQEFRKQDPDNVAIAFRKGLARGVDRKASARYSGVFGT